MGSRLTVMTGDWRQIVLGRGGPRRVQGEQGKQGIRAGGWAGRVDRWWVEVKGGGVGVEASKERWVSWQVGGGPCGSVVGREVARQGGRAGGRAPAWPAA